MSGRKLLFDTNVFIGLEDQKEVAPEFATLLQLCGQHGVHVFVHEAAIDDIKRDRDGDRRAISLSKVKKFELLKRVSQPQQPELERRFGTMPKANDVVDVALLHALDIGAVDFLVTQDQGIHGRARRCAPPIGDRVLTVDDAVAWLRATYQPKQVILPLIEEQPAHAIPLADDLFESLREGYPDFDAWWRDKCVRNHRQCWVATIDSELAGLAVRKEETHAEARTQHPGPKILKVCTFKVKPKFRGEKLGELLLKQILWFAQKNDYDLLYLTTFEDQKMLIDVLTFYGFSMAGTTDRGEQIYEKPLTRSLLTASASDNLFNIARINYPRFVARPPANVFCVPIRGGYHDVLFPEWAIRIQGDLFGAGATAGASQAVRRPGNTIRKVYLCRAPTTQLSPGSVLLFYRSQSRGYVASQCMTSVGVVEAVSRAHSFEDLIRLTAKRSVYSEAQLDELAATADKPVKVIDFLLIGHLDPLIPLKELVAEGVFTRHPPQSICALPQERFNSIRRRMTFGFEV